MPDATGTLEQLRFWSVCEIDALHETSQLAGFHLHTLHKEVDALKDRLETKAEATPVVEELDRLRGDTGEEFRKMRLELTKTFQELGGHVQTAFNQVSVVVTSFQSHISQVFEEAVTALKWLESQTVDRLSQLEAQIAQLQATASAPAAEANAEVAPPPAGAYSRTTTCRVASVPALTLRQNFSGCAAWPFACGCGEGATPGEASDHATEAATNGAPRAPRGPVGGNDTSRANTENRNAGECHCKHVTKLQEEVADLRAKYQHSTATFGAKPPLPTQANHSAPQLDGTSPSDMPTKRRRIFL